MDFSLAGSADVHEGRGLLIGTGRATPVIVGADASEETNPLGDVRFSEQVDTALPNVRRIVRAYRDLDRTSVPLRSSLTISDQAELMPVGKEDGP